MKERQYFFCNNLFFLYFQNQTLELAALSPSIESLNEASIKLPLSDFTMKKMQNLTRQWSQKTAAALECCRSERQTKQITSHNFLFCEKIENQVKVLEVLQSVLSFLRGLPGGILPFQFDFSVVTCIPSHLKQKPGCS